MGRKLGLCFFWGGELVSYLTQCNLGWDLPRYQVASWPIQHFGHNRHGPKSRGGCCASFGGVGAWSPSNRMWLGRGIPLYQVASCPSSPLATTDMGRKFGRCAPLGEGTVFPSNTMWPGPRPTIVPSGVLIHSTVWPQYTIVLDGTYQTDRTENGPIGPCAAVQYELIMLTLW